MKKFFIVFLFFVTPFFVSAQQLQYKLCCSNNKTDDSSPVRMYGGFGLGISNNGFYMDVQPGLLFRIRPGFYMGANLQLTYQSYKNLGNRAHYFVYGADSLAMYLPWHFLELSIDYQYLFVRRKVGSAVSHWEVPAFYLGAGYRTQNVAIGVRYDILYNPSRSIYPSAFTPYIRIYM